MSKQNKILLGLLAFVVVCTIGYALFSENITINGIATAKGDWELTTTCTGGISSELQYAPADTSEGFSNEACSVSGNAVTYSVNLAYPTANRFFTVKVKNTGTIAAKIEYYYGITRDDPYVCFVNSETNEKTCNTTTNSNFQFSDYGQLGIGTSDNKNYYLNNEIEMPTEVQQAINEMIVDTTIIIEPGESVYFVYNYQWNEGVGDQTGKNYITSSTTMHLPFSQLTADEDKAYQESKNK